MCLHVEKTFILLAKLWNVNTMNVHGNNYPSLDFPFVDNGVRLQPKHRVGAGLDDEINVIPRFLSVMSEEMHSATFGCWSAYCTEVPITLHWLQLGDSSYPILIIETRFVNETVVASVSDIRFHTVQVVLSSNV